MFLTRKNRSASAKNSRRTSCWLQLEQLENRCLLNAGTLDASFGAGGLATTSFARGNADRAYGVAVQVDGKVIAAGQTSSGQFGLVRYRSDGTLDSAFGSGGKVATSMGAGAGALDVAIYPNSGSANDGKIVVVGVAGLGGSNNHGFGVARYNQNGSLDKTFNKSGKATVDFSIGWDVARAVVIQPDGKIIAAGYSSLPDNNSAFTLVRLNVNGSLDSTFGNGGKVITDVTVSSGAETIRDVALDSNGKIVVAGKAPGEYSGTYSFALARYNADGSLDAGFGVSGIVLDPTGTGDWDEANAVLIQPDGKIIATGYMEPPPVYVGQLGMMRFNTSGALDSSFGIGGVALADRRAGTAAAILQPDGKIVTAGSVNVSLSGVDMAFGLGRFNSDGSPDLSFGNGGTVVTNPTSFDDSLLAVALQADGKIVAAGTKFSSYSATTGYDFDFAVARYLPSAPQIGSFTASPNPVTAGSPVTLTAFDVQAHNPGSTITQVAFYVDSNGDGVLNPATDALLGYGAQTSPGTWTCTFSTSGLSSGSHMLFALALDSYGVFSDPLALTLEVVE